MPLKSLSHPYQGYSYAFLDEAAKRELRRTILKSIAIPGYQVPYASREVPFARGWGTGGLQATLAIIGPKDSLKVIDQGDDDSVNAANLRRFITSMTGVSTTTDTQKASLIQSRHRIPEEILDTYQTLVLQVPMPEPLRSVEKSRAVAQQMHADADYGLMWLKLYEQMVRYSQITLGTGYPSLVHGRYVMDPSPIPRWDVPKLHQARHLTILSAGREKRLYAVPPFTEVRPLEFDDIPYRVEDQKDWHCGKTGLKSKFMNELPKDDGSSSYEISDSGYVEKYLRQKEGESIRFAKPYYDDDGKFYRDDVFRELKDD
ncbi:MAG: alpha-D-ribose 1-methylphosphonate 5-phosphate C-P-lyase PhnJ [Trueperaceae bacterium]|nr:alpha-D-ribose 1-methylphosphonate 5-phosphate C-P-lyase PhnJ [Trueperaceae bacterium]